MVEPTMMEADAAAAVPMLNSLISDLELPGAVAGFGKRDRFLLAYFSDAEGPLFEANSEAAMVAHLRGLARARLNS